MKYIESLKPYFAETEKIENGLIKIKLLELLYDTGVHRQKYNSSAVAAEKSRPDEHSAGDGKNLLNPVSIEDLAYLFGRSLSGFKRQFREIYNMPPARWIREKRLEKAKQLLAGSSYSVTDVCVLTGFSSFSHFSRVFKDRFGYSPSALKKGNFSANAARESGFT